MSAEAKRKDYKQPNITKVCLNSLWYYKRTESFAHWRACSHFEIGKKSGLLAYITGPYTKRLLYKGISTLFQKFRFLCSKASLLQEYGQRKVRLSTANTHSYRKGKKTSNKQNKNISSKSGSLNGWLSSSTPAIINHCDPFVIVDVPFREYVDLLLRPQSLDTLGSGECLFPCTVIL